MRPAPVSVRVVAAQMSAAMAVPEVRVRVPLAHMSATSVPNEVRVLPENAQIEFGRSANKEVEALLTCVFVFAFTSAETTAEISEAVGAEEVAMTNVRSSLIKEPFRLEPQDMDAGHVPWVLEENS